MITIKNIRPSILIIPDAGLKLTPGQSVDVDEPTVQVKKLLASGHLAQVKQDEARQEPSKVEPVQVNISKLAAPEAISRVNEEADPEAIKGYMETENRKTVLDAMKERMKELDNGKKA